jgi:Flp pilus assembly protein TadD
MDAYELLANSWIAAREYDRSLVPLQKAADLAPDGNLYVRLGQVRMQREEWGEAVRLFQKAIEKGDLKEPGNAYLLLGISLYNDERVEGARASFARARNHESSRTQADAWLAHIDKEAQQAS